MKENIFLKFPSNNFKFPIKKDLKENKSLINSHSQKIMNPIDTSINEDNQKKIKLTNNNNEQNKKKLENLLNLINNSIEFKNNEILDFKSFILTNHKKYHELLEELKNNEENLEKEQIKSIKLEKNLEINSKPIFNQINQNKIDENLSEKLEKKYTLLNEEFKTLKEKQKFYEENMEKTNFFPDYDKICKEVDKLRKINDDLTIGLKKLIPTKENSKNVK